MEFIGGRIGWGRLGRYDFVRPGWYAVQVYMCEVGEGEKRFLRWGFLVDICSRLRLFCLHGYIGLCYSRGVTRERRGKFSSGLIWYIQVVGARLNLLRKKRQRGNLG